MKLGKFAHINPKYQLDKDVSYPFVEMANLEVGKRYVKTSQFKKFKGSCTKFQHRDTLMARITPCLQNGKVSQFISEDNKLAFGSTEFIVFKERNGISDSNYLYYLVSSDIVRDPAIKSMSGATGRQRVNNEVIENIDVRNLDIKTQKKIAGILSTHDDLIENNNKRIKILEEMAQMLYKEWFVNFKFPNHQNTKFVDSELGRIPEGWEVKPIKDFGSVCTGKTPSTKNPDNFGNFMPFIKTPDMHNGIFCIKTSEYLSKKGVLSQRNKILPADSLCVSCIGTAGIVSITTTESQTNQQINSIVLNDLKHREFLYFTLSELKETILKYGSIGATMANLSKSKFEELKIIHPKEDFIIKFNETTKAFFDQIKNLLFKNQNLRKTRDLLLPRLISGELSVENLEVKT